MTATMKKVLIVGGTSGLGEEYARAFVKQGKTVIIAGRRQDRLDVLKEELPSLWTFQWDVSDLAACKDRVTAILRDHPDLDSVLLNAGVQKFPNFLDESSTTNESIVEEISINFSAPVVLTRLFLPHLAKVASNGQPANLMITSSGLAFTPFGYFPVYCATKAGMHSFCVGLRQQINQAPDSVKEKLNVIEIVPPYVDDTGLGDRDYMIKAAPKNVPMPLRDWMESSLARLAETRENGRPFKEIAAGTSQTRVDTWRNSVGKMYESMGIDC